MSIDSQEIRGRLTALAVKWAPYEGTWPKAIAQNPDETNARLLALNLAIDAGEVEYRPFDYLDAEESKNESG